MLDDAFFASTTLHERPVTLADGSTHRLHFRELTATQVRAYQIAEKSQDDQISAAAIAKLIASSVCEADGTPAMTYERAQQLKPRAANALVDEILQLNGMRATQAKKPLPPEAQSGSGTS
jgi:ATP-dependent exoDNAse (exonuclease V) alpha subunit